MRGLTWQTLRLSLAGSLETGDDVRAADPRTMAIAKDVQFEESGGAQTRHPFGSTMANVFGGGTLSNCRRIATVNDELVLFTDTTAFSWNEQQSKWVSRGTHLAVSVGETPQFDGPGDQIDCDRAELNGTVVFSWTEGAGSATSVYAAALDKSTGSVLVQPTAIVPAATFAGRSKLVALDTRILLFTDDGSGNLLVRAIDPADPATGFASVATTVLATVFFGKYDAVKIDGSDTAIGACNRNPTTSYTVFKVTAALAVSTSTKARVADGPLAVAIVTGGAQTQIARGNGVNIQGDLLTTSTLADVFTGQAIGAVSATINQITLAFSTVASGGFYTATVFWSREEALTGSGGFLVRNTVNNNNVIGTAAVVAPKLGLASRAFSAQGRVFVWAVFARQNEVTGFSGAVASGVRAALQNTLFMYRDDGLLVSKAMLATAGGHVPSSGRLPTVAPTSVTGLDFAWCATRRRRIAIGGGTDHQGYEARSPVDVAISFDSNASRRCVSLGQTLYVSDSILTQYDGNGLYEVGFLIYPYNFFITVGGAGSVAAGTYTYKSTLSWPNAQGEVDRSTTAFGATIVAPGANRHAITINALNVTRRTAARVAPAMKVWRTEVNAPQGAPFYQVTGNDPTQLAGTVDNGYIPNDIAALTLPSTGFLVLNDNFADATLLTKETNQDIGALLEPLVPPGASLLAATDTRLFLAGVPGDPDRVWYSRERGDGEVASFHDILTIDIPRQGGSITSLWVQDEVLYVGRETAIYALPGVGFDNLGQGQNFGPAREVSLDVGPVSQEALAKTALGTVFKSRKGWYLLERGGGVRLIGNAVSAYDSETVHAVTVLEGQHHVRILTNARMLIWDYRPLVDPTDREGVGKWMEWSVSDGVHACMWNGRYVYLTATGPRIEAADFTGTAHGMDLETKWLPLTELQSAAKVRAAGVLGEYRSSHLLRIRAARDWQYDGAGNVVYFDDHAWSPSPTTVGSALQVMTGLTQDSMQALKLRITAVTDAARATLVTTTLSPQVDTDSSAWSATWRAAAVNGGLTAYGEMGNRLTMSIAYVAFMPPILDSFPYELPFEFVSEVGEVIVNDHFSWNVSTGKWEEDLNNIGVLVAGTVTVAELEAAIAEGTTLATLQTADTSPAKVVDVAGMLAAGDLCAAGFSGGTYGAPTGEALKLTNLALEVGLRTGLTKRLPAEQKA